MSELFVCGTGGWNGPKPGDPDNNLVLRAVPAFGGIDVSWTYPDRNPEAVAHTILFRGISGIFAGAAKHAIVSGNFFYDKTDTVTPIEYFYWIQVVSVNGTYGELIGPAKATARPLIAEMIQQLTGQIDSGVLAQSLKQSLDQITLNKLGITQEMLDRDAADETLGVALNEVTAHSGETRALLQQEVLARAEANEAFVSAVNTIYAELGTGLAAVQKVQAALVTSSKAQASDITQVQSTLNGDTAAGRIGLTTIVEKHGNTLTNIGALYTAQVQVNGLIGGFGVYNDGRFVEAGFDVDTFWIGRTTNKKKPFIVSGGEVFIDQAVINQLTFDKLRAADGSFIVANGLIRANYIQIGIAQVDTLMIQGNAVTIPAFVQAYDSTLAYGWTNVLELGFYMPVDGWLYASSTGYISYSEGFGHTESLLAIDGQVVSRGGGTTSWVNAAHSGGVRVGAGYHTIQLQYMSPSGKGVMNARSLFAMAVKR